MTPRFATALALLASAAVCANGGAPRTAETPCVLDKCTGEKPATPDTAPATPAPEPSAPAESTTAPAAPAPSEGFVRRTNPGTGSFDFYVLALSWSPGFCSTGGASKAPDQCASGSNLGFVVHGLWPQYEHGYLQNCGTSAFPTRAQIEAVHDLYPDDGLARHEWRAHGTCVGKSPTDYFADVRRARQAVTVPEAYRALKADQEVATVDISRAFLDANPGLSLNEMAVTCRSQVLEEVRICFTKDLRSFHPCPEVSRQACRTRQINVPAMR